jgi:hypothetical protein
VSADRNLRCALRGLLLQGQIREAAPPSKAESARLYVSQRLFQAVKAGKLVRAQDGTYRKGTK